MLAALALLTSAFAVDVYDMSDEVAAEVCVEIERPLRREGAMPDRGAGYSVPESWARARASLGRGRLPQGTFDPDAFVSWLPHEDPAPIGEDPLALVVEAAPHPTDADRLLVRVGMRSPDPRTALRDPVHLVALVNVAHSMRSVPTRTYPLLQDALPERGQEAFFFPKVDRLSLAQSALRELVQELPEGSVVAVAAFDRGAAIALEPTSLRRRAEVIEAIDGLSPGLIGGDRGLDLVAALVRRMRTFCGDTRVVVLSDGPTGLGGDPDQALAEVASQASKGVTVSTVAPATGLRRIRQLEQLAWVGYGRHHYADTLDDAMMAFRSELAEPGWVARDVKISVEFNPAGVAEVRSIGQEDLDWYIEGLPRGEGRGALYEVVLADGADADALLDVRWEAGSPMPGEWTRAGHVTLGRQELPSSFEDSQEGVRLAWVAAGFADRLSGLEGPDLSVLYDAAVAARRDGVRADVELIALIDRAARLEVRD